jgi:fatty acid synthase subunit alpha
MDPDHIIPFAAIGEVGRAIDGIDSKSELAHRIMLTNLIRLLGAIKTQKHNRRIRTHPTQVILPFSPNHGIFGNDGLYAESKIGLEGLLNKWWSEDWNSYLCLCGTIIGWTRGTALMTGNDVLAAGVEETGMKTFSKTEMALQVAGLMSSPIASYCELEPLIADISGGMASHSSLSTLLVQLQEGVNSMSETRRAILKEQTLDKEVITGSSSVNAPRNLNRRARIELDEPSLPDYESKIAPLAAQLEGMVDLDRVVVVVGFGETGKPQNSAFVYNQSTNCQNKDRTGTAEHDGKWRSRVISLWKVASSWHG